MVRTLIAISVLVVFALVAGCGATGPKYEGQWVSEGDDSGMVMEISKVDDGYKVQLKASEENSGMKGLEMSMDAKEEGDKLIVTFMGQEGYIKYDAEKDEIIMTDKEGKEEQRMQRK